MLINPESRFKNKIDCSFQMNALFLLNVALPAVVAPADQVPPAPGVTIVTPAITGTGTQGSMLCRELLRKIGKNSSE